MDSGGSAAQLPAEVARLLAANPQALCGIDPAARFAWAFARSTLLAWQYDQGSLSQVPGPPRPDPTPPSSSRCRAIAIERRGDCKQRAHVTTSDCAQVLQHRLPYPSSGRHFVQILPATRGTSSPGALLCTEDGNVSVWPDLADASAPPLQARVAGTVCAVAAAPSPGDGGFVAAFATTGGALHVLQVMDGSAWRGCTSHASHSRSLVAVEHVVQNRICAHTRLAYFLLRAVALPDDVVMKHPIQCSGPSGWRRGRVAAAAEPRAEAGSAAACQSDRSPGAVRPMGRARVRGQRRPFPAGRDCRAASPGASPAVRDHARRERAAPARALGIHSGLLAGARS